MHTALLQTLCLAFVLAATAGCRNGSASHRQQTRHPIDSPGTQQAGEVVLKPLVEGQGTPLVMLGGGVAGAAGFAFHAQELAKQFAVIRLESLRMERAQGDQPLPQGYSIRAESAAMARSLNQLDITGPVHVVGHSFGALIALDFALNHPERVRSLVLAEPPAFWVVPPEELRADLEMRAMIDLLRMLGPSDEPTDQQLVQFQTRLGKLDAQPPARGRPGWDDWLRRRRALRGLSAVSNHRDDPRRLRAFTRPVLVVTGTKTVAFHRRINDLLVDTLPDVERVELDAGHDAPSTRGSAFIVALQEFLARHP